VFEISAKEVLQAACQLLKPIYPVVLYGFYINTWKILQFCNTDDFAG
jgi:hypothetical protein